MLNWLIHTFYNNYTKKYLIACKFGILFEFSSISVGGSDGAWLSKSFLCYSEFLCHFDSKLALSRQTIKMSNKIFKIYSDRTNHGMFFYFRHFNQDSQQGKIRLGRYQRKRKIIFQKPQEFIIRSRKKSK